MLNYRLNINNIYDAHVITLYTASLQHPEGICLLSSVVPALFVIVEIH